MAGRPGSLAKGSGLLPGLVFAPFASLSNLGTGALRTSYDQARLKSTEQAAAVSRRATAHSIDPNIFSFSTTFGRKLCTIPQW